MQTPDDDALKLQSAAHASGDLLVWTICENPSDYPGLFTARPHSTRANAPLDLVLTAPSIEAIHAMLPLGLTWFPREDGDDPVIVETWL